MKTDSVRPLNKNEPPVIVQTKPRKNGEKSEEFTAKFYWERALTTSTVHRIGSVYKTKSIVLKVILGSLWLLSFSYCSYQILLIFLAYTSYSVLTTTSYNYQIPAEFPVVQWCNLNQYDQNYNSTLIDSIVEDGTINASNYETITQYHDAVNNYFRAQLIKRSLNREFNMTLLAFDISQMLISCRFNGHPCTKDDFMEYYDYYYGLCYRFNQGRSLSGEVLNISVLGLAGAKYGLQMELYAGAADLQEKYVIKRGFRLLVFNKSDVNQVAQDVGIDIATGLNTNVAVERTFTNHLPSPYGYCLPTDITQVNWKENDVLKFMYDNYIDGSYFNTTNIPAWNADRWNWTLTYSQLFCLKMCFMKYLYQNCKCYDITVPLTPKNQDGYLDKVCVRGNDMKCMKKKQREFYSDPNLFGPCYTKCPIECNHINYNLRTDVSTYPPEWYSQVLANSTQFNELINRYFDEFNKTNISYVGRYEALKSSVARVNVYYEDLSFKEINESPAMTFDLFLGSVGGNMGLFLGASLLTITELLEVSYLIISLKVRQRRSKMREKLSNF